MPLGTIPSIEEFGAVLVGFDVEGFSRTVEKAALRHGRVAGELAAQQILAGERVVTDLAHQAGLRFADALGDGAVYLRAQPAPSQREIRALQRFQEELKYAHLKHTGLAVRTAWTYGPVRLVRPTAPILEQGEVLWGPAVAQLHAILADAPRGRRAAAEPTARAAGLMHREGEIAEMTFVFLRLCRSADWLTLDEATLNGALGLIARWAERLGGRLERVTQDEKGVHVRVGLPGSGGAEAEWREALLEPQAALRGLGLDGAIAAAGGPVYRGPSDHGSTIVHGGAVNRAAKLCAAQGPGGLALDPSLGGRAGRPPPLAAMVVGRGAEMDQSQAWLSGGRARMVILTGESGVGKSHLLRNTLVRGEAATRAFVAGAPARMLDPMGCWFELLSQALSMRPGDGPDDWDWGLDVLARAGVETWTLPLCARALRGVEPDNARTAALTGGERARRTQEAMVALVSALTADGPWLVAMDDLHELDDASLGLTLAILDAGLWVRIIATTRPVAGLGRLSELRAHLSTLELPLSPLSAPDIAHLVASLVGPNVDVAEVMAISGGNPFQAVQAALALAEDGEGDGERTLGAILDRRIDRLDVDEREVLRALALAERAWGVEDLAALVSPGDGAPDGGIVGAAAALGRLARAKLVALAATDPETFQVSHRLLAEGVRRRTPDGVRRRLAHGAARRLSRAARAGPPASDVEIARLWEAAGSRGRAAVLYERAARAAALVGADRVCAQLLGLALRLFTEDPRKARPKRTVRWFAELSRAQWSLGLVDTANQNARQSVADARRGVLPRRLRANALAASALRVETGQFLGDLREIFIGSVEARRFGASTPESIIARGRGLGALGYMFGLLRLSRVSDHALRRGERLATPADERPAAFVLTARAMVDFVFARWPRGEAALASARRICADWPEHQLMEWIETTCGIGAHLQGDGGRALAHFAVLARLAAARGSSMHAGWADYATAQTLLALDQPHEAWARLASADDHLKGVTDRQSHHICLGLRARLAWRLGEVDEALAAAALCGEMGRALAPTNHTSTEAFSAPALVGALALATPLSASQRQAARGLVHAHLAELTRYAWVFPIARPRAALVRAAIEAPRAPLAASARLDAAALRAEAMGLRFEAALARRIQADLATRLP